MASTGPAIPILIVDDEVDFLAATARALERRGFDVRTATDGITALRVLAEQEVAVAVLDVRMPGIDGVELFGRIRIAYPELPVIMLTGHGTVQQAFQTSREGIYEYLTKPCELELLALVARRAVTSATAALPVAEPAGPIRLLFVDDEEDFLESLTPALARRGMQVTPVATPQQALDLARLENFDVALVDMKMPEMDGLHLARRLRAEQPAAEIVVLTGHPTMGQAFEAVKEGAFDFLMKPAGVDAIAAKIRQAFHHGQRRQAEQRARQLQQRCANKLF